MPTIRAPDGRRLRVPDGTPPEAIMAVLEAQGYDLSGTATPPPAPTPPGGGLPAPPSPAPALAAPTIPAPGPAPVAAPPGPVQRTPEEYQQLLAAERAKVQQAMADDMTPYQKVTSGMGQSVASTGRGIRQLWNYMTGDDEELAQLMAQEEEDRRLDAPLLSTGAGRGGQIGGHVLQALVPAGLVAKGAKAANLGLRGTMAAEAGLGAAQGATQPIVDGESRKTNATVGAVIGGAIPGVGAAFRAAKEMPATILANALRIAAPRGTGGLVDLAARGMKTGSDKVRKKAGEEIGKIVQDVRVPLRQDLVAKLRSVKSDYAESLPKDVVRKLEEWMQLAQSGKASVKGTALQEARSAIGRQAQEAEGIAQAGLQRVKRIIDDTLQSNMTKAQIKALRDARDAYRTGVRPGRQETADALKRAGVRGAAHGLRAGSMPVTERKKKK